MEYEEYKVNMSKNYGAFLIILGTLGFMSLSQTALASEEEETTTLEPSLKIAKTEESSESQKIFPLLSLDPDLFERVGKFLPPRDIHQLAQVSQYCLKSMCSHLNLELSLEGKTLTEEVFLNYFGAQGFYKEAQYLNLSGASFNPAWLRHLPKTLKSLKLNSINTKHSKNYGYKKKSMFLIDIVKMIGNNALPKLKYFDISNNSLEDNGTEHIAQMNSLKYLNISNNRLGVDGAKHISQMASLNSLKISNNRLGANGAKHISQMASLSTLNISRNLLGDTGAEYISQMTSLESLNISKNRLGVDGAKNIAQMTSLKSLNISKNRLGVEGAELIAQMTSLNFLNIANNNLRFAAAQYFAEMASLKSLNIANNHLGVAGAKYISQMASLNCLNISNNGIADSGAKHISQMAYLKSLNISKNGLGRNGAAHICQMTSLNFLDISNNFYLDNETKRFRERFPFCRVKF